MTRPKKPSTALRVLRDLTEATIPVEFKSPSGRLVLVVEGHRYLSERDITWLKFVGGRPGLINERIERDAETGDRQASERE